MPFAAFPARVGNLPSLKVQRAQHEEISAASCCIGLLLVG